MPIKEPTRMLGVREEARGTQRAERVDALLGRIVARAALSLPAEALFHAACASSAGAPRLVARAHSVLSQRSYHGPVSNSAPQSTVRPDETASPFNQEADTWTARAVITEIGRLFPANEGGLDRDEFWRHALATAWTARTLAGQCGLDALAWPGFMTGLLLHVGQLALDAHAPKSYARVLRRAASAPAELAIIEDDILGVDHTVVGKRLAEAWGLPTTVCTCLWQHEPATELPGMRGLTHIVSRAEYLADQAGFPLPGAGRSSGAGPLTAGGLTADEGTLCARIATQVQRLTAWESDAASASTGGASSTTAHRARQQCQRALQIFARTACPDADSAKTCGFIATAVYRAFAPSAVVVVAVPPHVDHAVAAMVRASDDDARSIVLTGAHLYREALLDDEPDPTDALVELPPLLVQHLASEVGVDPGVTVALALRSGAARNGLVLLLSPVFDAGWSALAADDRALLADTWGHALACAAQRDHLARQTETLLTAHRRTTASRRAASAAASLGMMAEMSAGAAHELNNPLAVIAGRAQMLLRNASDGPVRRDLAIIDEHARRASNIVSELLEYAKPAPPQPRTLHVREWAEQIRQYWERNSSVQPGQLLIDVADTRLTMYADEGQVTDAAHAVIANAVEACRPENMRLRINSESIASDDTMVVSIGDNGRGMPPEVLAHACDPFFSHRPAGRGRGLGLSRAARLVELNAGRLWIDSSPATGTTVYFALPTRAS